MNRTSGGTAVGVGGTWTELAATPPASRRRAVARNARLSPVSVTPDPIPFWVLAVDEVRHGTRWHPPYRQ